jgi:UPF0755 protein
MVDRTSIVILAVLVALAGATWLLSGQAAALAIPEPRVAAEPVAISQESVSVTVRQGDTPAMIARRLEQNGVIRSARHFAVLTGLMGVEGQLQAGEYELTKGMPTTLVIERLKENIVLPQFVLTIPEGWRWEQVAEHLERRGIASYAEIEAALNATDYNAPFLAQRPPGASLEGYLFPDTYFFTVNATPRDVIARLLQTFQERFPPEWQEQAKAHGLTLHQAVTIASIVEREAQVPEERPIIASVYLNRVRAGMQLEADPTTQYALAQNPESVAQYGWWKRALTLDDLKVQSPYNTYVTPGIPPGPIASPGQASLRAVARPAETQYLFFVARPDGSHAFARTFEEHLANVNRYQR